MSFPNAYEALVSYLDHPQVQEQKNGAGMVKSAFRKVVAPALGSPLQISHRASARDDAALFEHLKQISFDQLLSVLDDLESYLQQWKIEEEEKYSKAAKTQEERKFEDRIRSFRFYLGGFKAYLNPYRQVSQLPQNEQIPFTAQEKPKRHRLRSPNGTRRPQAKNEKRRTVPPKAAYALGTHPGDYITPHLAQQLKNLEEFVKAPGNSSSTVQMTLGETNRLLGWFARLDKQYLYNLEELADRLAVKETEIEEASARLSAAEFALWAANKDCDQVEWYAYGNEVWYPYFPENFEQLSLEALVPLVNLKVEPEDFTGKRAFEEYSMAEVRAKREVEEAAVKVIKLLDAYQDFRKAPPKTESFTIRAMLHITTFLYKEQPTGRDFANLPIVGKLRDRLNDLLERADKSPPTVPFHTKSIPWTQCFNVLSELREAADQLIRYVKAPRLRSGYREIARKGSGIATSLQHFLSVALMILIPPDRSRTYYELEMHKTLRFGYKQDNIFVSVDLSELGEDTSKALLWIHLEAEDYKTGKFYGLYEAILPNVSAHDLGGDKSLYEYIALWWHKYRKELNPSPDNNRFFIGQNGKLLNAEDWYHRIVYIFYKHTQKPVTPKELRKMFISFLKSRDATLAEREGAWISMHHSRKMQDEVYDQQAQEDKTAFIYDFNNRVRAELIARGNHQGNSQSSSSDSIQLNVRQVLSYLSKLDSKQRREFAKMLSPQDKHLLGLD